MIRRFIAFEKYQFRKRKRSSITRLKNLQNRFHGPAIVLANGPSSLGLLRYNLSSLSDHYSIFAMNNFYRSNLSKHITPNYLMICDEPYWAEKYAKYRDFINSLQNTSDLMIIQPDYLEFFGKADQTIQIRRNSLFSFLRNIKVDSSFSGLPSYTTFYAIATALYLGYHPIYVAGFDLNHYKYVNVNENGVFLESHHNYKEPTSAWRKRDTLSKVLSASLSQIESLKLFLGKEVYILGEQQSHDILPYLSLDKFFNQAFEP